jgi:hypothetical protein
MAYIILLASNGVVEGSMKQKNVINMRNLFINERVNGSVHRSKQRVCSTIIMVGALVLFEALPSTGFAQQSQSAQNLHQNRQNHQNHQNHQNQDSRVLSLYDWQSYEWISQLQSRGHLLELHPTDMPYRYDEVREAVRRLWEGDGSTRNMTDLEQQWATRLAERVEAPANDDGRRPVLDLRASTYWQVNNSEREDAYRPTDDQAYLWPMVEVAASMRHRGWVVQANPRFEYYEDRNIDGLDAVNRFWTRNEEAYVGYSNDFLEVYSGRVLNHWGIYGANGAMISDHSVTYDQLKINLGTKHLQLSSVMGYLDNLKSDGIYNGDTREDPLSVKRFLFAKRLDWRPRPYLMFSYRESLIFSGWDAIPQPKYWVPGMIGFFQADNAPQNDFINYLTGIALWAQIQRANTLSLHTEIILDDVIFFRERRGIDERSTYNVMFNAQLALAERPINLKLKGEMISAQSYNTDQAEGRYLYLGRGIGAPFNDYVFGEFEADWFVPVKEGRRGLDMRLSPYAGALLQGEQVIDKEFIGSPLTQKGKDPDELEPVPDFVLSGVVQQTVRFGLKGVVQSTSGWWIRGDIGLNIMRNMSNVEGNDSTRPVGMIEAGYRFDFALRN